MKTPAEICSKTRQIGAFDHLRKLCLDEFTSSDSFVDFQKDLDACIGGVSIPNGFDGSMQAKIKLKEDISVTYSQYESLKIFKKLI